MQKKEQSILLHCGIHRNSYYQFISVASESSQNRLLCAECLFPEEQGNDEKKFNNLIPLSIVLKVLIQAINSPDSLLNWIKKDTISANFKKFFQFTVRDIEKELNEQISKFDQIIKVIEQFKQQMSQQIKEYKNLQAQFKKYREPFFEVFKLFIKKINYNKFCQLLFQLQELDQQYKSDQYSQVAKEFAKTVDEMLKDDCALISKEINLIYQDHAKTVINLQQPNDDQFQKQIIQTLQQYEQFINKLNEDICIKSSFLQLLTNEYFQTLEQKIERDSKMKIKQNNLIYLGSRDGLNGDAFWSKVNGKKNLLMIFKSKNKGNYIFGEYSPCLWQSNLNKWVQDDTLTSFLFSQSHNEIYPLKQDKKQQAIYCSQSYGPTFGGGHDLYIQPDFKDGGSNLGYSYQSDKFKNAYTDYLFGEIKPNIMECEIYQLIFS